MKNMSAGFYVDKAVFQQERTGLFTGTWQLFGHSDQVHEPGRYISDDIAGMAVFVIRSHDNELRAFRNVCRHRGARLLEAGTGECKRLRCPYHNWVYETTGALTHAPWFGDDPEFNIEDWPLEPVAVEQWRGLVFVSLNPQVTLLEQLGASVAELSDVPVENYHLCDTRVLEFEANWKIYTDNFVEGYHIPGIHPEFFKAIDFSRFETTANDGLVKMTAPPRENLFYQGRWLWMWPNWTLSLFDGGMNTSRINPLDENRTQLIYRFYFEDSSVESKAKRHDTIERNLDVVREDFSICIATHQNYATDAYTPGPLSPLHEKGVDYFQQRYMNVMHF